MNRQRKSAIITFRVTPEEAMQIKQRAAKKQTTVSKYVREQLIWSYDYVLGDDPGYRELSLALEKYLNSTYEKSFLGDERWGSRDEEPLANGHGAEVAS